MSANIFPGNPIILTPMCVKLGFYVSLGSENCVFPVINAG